MGGCEKSLPNGNGRDDKKTSQGKAMKRIMVLGTTAILLGGCALPVPFQVASWAIDGISYLMTEKTIADHGISILAQKDCAVLRGLLGDGKFCRDYDDTAIMVADAEAGLSPVDEDEFIGLDGPEGDELAALTYSTDFDAAPVATDNGARTNARPIIDDGIQITAVLTYQPLVFEALFFEEGPPVFFEDGPQLPGYPLEIVVKVAPVQQAALAPRAPQADTIDVGEIADFSTAAGSAETLEVASIFTEPFVDEDPAVALPETKAQDWRAETIITPGITPGMTAKTEFEPGRELGDEPQAGLYFVIGSFREHKNARKLRSQYRILTPSVLAANLEQGIVFRVVVGPFVDTEAKRVHMAIFQAGISDSWAIRVKPGEWSMARVDPPAPSPVVAWKVPEKPETTVLEFIQQLAQLRF